MTAIKSSIYEEIEISTETSDSAENNRTPITIDLKLGTGQIDIFEDIFSPTITAKILVVVAGGAEDKKGNKLVGSLYSGLPIRGGERVSIKIAGNFDGNDPIEFNTPDTYLYVSNVSRQFGDNMKEIFTLDLVSREAITNETSRVIRRFSKENKVSDTVQTIIKESLASTISEDNIDKTRNKYGFIGNLKKPFKTLVWLAAKSVPEDGLPGYFFYQTRRGFNFRSIDSLIKRGKKEADADEDRKKYYEVNFTKNSKISDTGNQHVLQYAIVQNNDLITKLTMGQFRNQIMEFDPLLGTFTTEQQGKLTLDDVTKKSIDLGLTTEVPKLLSDDDKQNLGTLPSRLITMVTDRGVLEFDPEIDKSTESNTEWQRQLIIRYQLLFTQILNMVVPLNTKLHAGDVIKVDFLNADQETKEKDRRKSGYYLIKNLCHHFDPNQSLTSMTLIRDNYGEVD
tara:strand:+ start:1465 stop:2823 length:1359 start_codon:yes stop_codon:yes gene_type:complete